MTLPRVVKTFRIVWKRTSGNRWYVRNERADSLSRALHAALQSIDRKNPNKDQSPITVDHLVQEFDANGHQSALHSLSGQPQPFSVFYRNTAWRPNDLIPKNS